MRNILHHIKTPTACLLALFIYVATSPVLSAHTFHTSLMQMEYNPQEQLVEISVQVFSHDLETVLSRRNGKTVRLDRTAGVDKLVLSYLQDTINITNGDGQAKTLSWVGMEAKADAVWLYVEAKMPEGLAGAQVRNRILFDLLDDQVNIVHAKYDGRKADLVFKPGDGFKSLARPPQSR